MNAQDDDTGNYHRVIACSLEKIADSHNRRKSSLHKNLLINSILQKAYQQYDKEARRLENPDGIVYNDQDTANNSSVEDIDENSRLIVEPTEGNSSTLTCFDPPLPQVGSSLNQLGNQIPPCDFDKPEDISPKSFYNLPHKENTNFATTQTTFSSNKRSLKRKRSDDYSDEYSNQKKKCKDSLEFNHFDSSILSYFADSSFMWRNSCEIDFESDLCDNFKPPSNDDFYSTISSDSSLENSMDVDQLCGLISIFQNSFQGLVENYSERKCANFSKSTSTLEIDNLPSKEQKFPLRKGHSLPDLCAKEASEHLSSRLNFELCPSPLALTV